MLRKQILYGITTFFLIWITSATIIAKAHSASDLELDYNSNTDVLSVTITHTVSDPNSHIIDSVKIDINGSQILFIDNYTSQPTTSTFTYEYSITANSRDLITVTATCNRDGSIKRTLTVGEGQGDPIVDDSIPGYLGIMIFISASIFITSLIIHKRIKKK